MWLFTLFRDDVNGVEAVTECSSSDFLLIPPDLITFNATQYILDNFGRRYSRTETSFQIVCTFSSGGIASGIDSPVNFTILLQQGELLQIWLEHVYYYDRVAT